MANPYGYSDPSHTRLGDPVPLTNEMIRDQHIANTTAQLRDHQQYVHNRQRMETDRIGNQLHDRQQLQLQPNATHSYYINKMRQLRGKWGLHTPVLNRSFSHMAHSYLHPTTSTNTNAIPLHSTSSRLFTNSFISSIHNPPATIPTATATAPVTTASSTYARRRAAALSTTTNVSTIASSTTPTPAVRFAPVNQMMKILLMLS